MHIKVCVFVYICAIVHSLSTNVATDCPFFVLQCCHQLSTLSQKLLLLVIRASNLVAISEEKVDLARNANQTIQIERCPKVNPGEKTPMSRIIMLLFSAEIIAKKDMIFNFVCLD